MTAARDYWFRRGLLRHAGLMLPEMVAEAVAHAVTLPPAYQYDAFSVIPTAPAGPLPESVDALVAEMIRRLMP